jgi:two-component system, response regulator PdtaR
VVDRRVLIVEDEVIIADELEWRLTQEGYSVIASVGSGEEALSVVDNEPPDVVLMDIQLQGKLNGVEAGRLIRQKTGAAIIFVTAFPTALIRSSGPDDPPTVCLNKPFSALQLRAALHSIQSAA